MNFKFRSGQAITGVLAVLPAREVLFADEMRAFGQPEDRSRKLAQVMGYDRRRIVEPGTTCSDLAVAGIEHLLENGSLSETDIDALVVVTQTPDRLMPPTSSVIHGRLGLKRSMVCVDVNQGCAGYVLGLIQAFMLLEQKEVRKVVLVNVDVMSRKTSTHDRNSWPLIGDAAAITVLERRHNGATVEANVQVDGGRREALTIPAGGIETPSSPETATLHGDGSGNSRALDHLVMDGQAVFQFVMTEVPPMIERLLIFAGATREDVDAFYFHQPNRFMLEKLADKLGVCGTKIPMNVVERYGNSSGCTIPVAIAYNFAPRDQQTVCLAGFGVGLTWASMLMQLGPLDFCEMIDYRRDDDGK